MESVSIPLGGLPPSIPTGTDGMGPVGHGRFSVGGHQFRVVIAPQGRVSKHANGTLRLHKVCFLGRVNEDDQSKVRELGRAATKLYDKRNSWLGRPGDLRSLRRASFRQLSDKLFNDLGRLSQKLTEFADESGNAPKKDDPVQLERWLGQVLDIRKDLLAGLAAMNHNASLHRQLHEIIVPVLATLSAGTGAVIGAYRLTEPESWEGWAAWATTLVGIGAGLDGLVRVVSSRGTRSIDKFENALEAQCKALFDTPSVSVLLYAHVVERVVHEALEDVGGDEALAMDVGNALPRDEDNNDLGEDDNKQFHQRLNEPVGKAVTKALADLKLETIVSEDRKSELRVLASALIIEELKSIKRVEQALTKNIEANDDETKSGALKRKLNKEMEKFRSFSKDLQGMSSDNGKGGSVNANEQTIFQLIKDFRLAREADEAMKLRAREQRDGSSSGSGGPIFPSS